MGAPVTLAHGFGPTNQPLAGWVTNDESGATGSGVLIAPPIGYEYWTSHRTLRVLAEQLAGAGHLVLRMDYRGTGDSSGDQWDITSTDVWLDDVRAGVRELRGRGATRVSIVGLRFGGMLALGVADSVGVDAVVAWALPASGRRYVKELQLLSMVPPGGVASVGGPGTRFVAGTAFTAELLADIAAIGPNDLACTPCKVLVLDRAERPASDTLVATLAEAGADVTHLRLEGAGQFLDLPTEYATVPVDQLAAIVDWLEPCADGARTEHRFEPASPMPMHAAGAEIVERVLELGSNRLVAVESRGVNARKDAVTVVLLNTGSEHHVGAGRVWVEYARQLAAAGDVAVRVDFRGWGESPDAGFAPGRPFDAHGVDDTRDVVQSLRDRGDERVVLVGLCAGAWIALRRCWELPLAGVLALNPPLYWQPGDVVEATMAETRRRVELEQPREALWAKLRVWTLLDLFGIKVPGSRWLEQIAAAPFPVAFYCAADDDGLEYIRRRLRRPLRRAQRSSSFRITEFTRVDHSMHRHWFRDEPLAAITSFIDQVR